MKCLMIVVLALATAHLALPAPAAQQLDTAALARRVNIRHHPIPRKILAFYYPWYANPQGPGGRSHGGWYHWENVDQPNKQIGSSTNYPILGPYDSHDPAIIARHCDWAKQAGIDGFCASYWHKGGYEDQAIPELLRACQQAKLELTVYYETVSAPQNAQSAADDLLYILNRYAAHPAWLKVNGQPVIFVYNRVIGEIGLVAWLDALSLLSGKYSPAPLVIADQMSRPAAMIFDGVHTYATAGQLNGRTPAEVGQWARQTYPNWVKNPDKLGRISTITVLPAYDDHKIRTPSTEISRFGGELYRSQWQEALAANPDWILITSWNEWHEGSEIEPSVEYGTHYLEMTAQFAKRFKALPPKPLEAEAADSQLPQAERARLARKLGAIGVAALPKADSPAFWWLAELGVTPTLLTWDDVVKHPPTAERFGILLYAAGEHYQQTVKVAGDVDRAILAYLKSGGCLVSMARLPAPFYYNEKDEVVESTTTFGLPLSVRGPDGGWENPPANVSLKFVKPKGALPHLPDAIAYPTGSDSRWRPFVAKLLPAHQATYNSLLELRDEKGNSYGHGAVYVEYKGGKLKGAKHLYAWFGLLDHPQADAILYDSFDWLATRLGK